MLPAADALIFALPPCHAEAAALIPPPRMHRHRYHGVLVPNAPLRAQVTAWARPLNPQLTAVLPVQQPQRSPARYLWALLLARIYEVLPLRCSLCGSEMRVIAFVTERPAIHSILRYPGRAHRRAGSLPRTPIRGGPGARPAAVAAGRPV